MHKKIVCDIYFLWAETQSSVADKTRENTRKESMVHVQYVFFSFKYFITLYVANLFLLLV